MGDIVDYHLIWESVERENLQELIAVVCATTKSLLVFDEQDTEESKLLRTITGMHNEPISCSAFSFHLSLIATGSQGGEIAVLDFETSKVLGLLVNHE